MAASDSRPCKRCKAQDAPYNLRRDPTCRDCYISYVDLKMAKRLAALHRETRLDRGLTTRRYLAGLSFGPSSSVLVRILHETAQRLSSTPGTSPFEPLAVHIDTDLSSTSSSSAPLLDRYRARFPSVRFECVHLSRVLQVRSIDWAALPLGGDEGEPVERLRGMFNRLSSATARADVLRLLVRHLLLHEALEGGYAALLLGHSTTALAALTLAEVANGRGFAVPWQVNDGLFPVCSYDGTEAKKEAEFPVYYPLREIFRGETLTYTNIEPTLEDLVVPDDTANTSVVSHKDLSIDEVMTRYFTGVEDGFAGIVANVVKTAGKLERLQSTQGGFCGSCGVTLDEQGDSRWAGEIGDDGTEGGGQSRLCYGCKRSVHG